MSAQNDAAFLRMFMLVLGALVLFTVIILIIANSITGAVEDERGEDPRVRAAISERIKPVGSVNVASAAPEVAAAAPRSGADVAAVACNSCHIAGVLEAPKIGDAAAWEQRLAAAGGVDGLTTSAINGKGQMPARGGSTASDAEIRAAVEHLLAESGVDAGAPAPAAATSAEAPASPVAAVAEAATEMAGGMVDSAQSMVAAAVPAMTGTPAAPAAPAVPPAAQAAPAAAAPAPAVDLAKGKAVYDGACFVCHVTGAAGAPLLGDTNLWAPRIAQGMDALMLNAINGKGAMPPKGGRMDLSDDDVRAAVAYMVEQSK